MILDLLLVGLLGAQAPDDAISSEAPTRSTLAQRREAVRKTPDDPGARLALGMAYAEAGEYDLAMAELVESIRLNPDNKENLSGRANFHLGLILTALERPALATKVYREAIRLGLKDAAVYTALAQTLSAEGKFAEAIPEYQRALALTPDSFGALAGLAVSMEATGQLEEALAQYEAALRVAPPEDDHAVDAIKQKMAALKERRQL